MTDKLEFDPMIQGSAAARQGAEAMLESVNNPTIMNNPIDTDKVDDREPAIATFKECDGYDEKDPVERLRFFCSILMKRQDWIDIEPFFDDVVATINKQAEETVIYKDRYENTFKGFMEQKDLAWEYKIKSERLEGENEELKRKLSKKNISNEKEFMRNDETDGNMSDIIDAALERIDKWNKETSK